MSFKKKKKIKLVKLKCILANFVQKYLAQMIEVAGDLHWVSAYFENPASFIF